MESDEEEDDKQWLTYWVVYAFFYMFDMMFGTILSVIPIYYLLKLGALLYMMHPSTMGASKLYDAYLLNFVNKYFPKIYIAKPIPKKRKNKPPAAIHFRDEGALRASTVLSPRSRAV